MIDNFGQIIARNQKWLSEQKDYLKTTENQLILKEMNAENFAT